MESQQIFFIVWAILMSSMLLMFFLKGKKAISIFPSIDSVQIKFREKWVSGHSMKSFITKLGGAQNILDVIVTQDELWIKSPLLFAGFGKTYDLLHKVNLKDVLEVSIEKDMVEISFKTIDDSSSTLNLKMKKATEFVRIIKENIN